MKNHWGAFKACSVKEGFCWGLMGSRPGSVEGGRLFLCKVAEMSKGRQAAVLDVVLWENT